MIDLHVAGLYNDATVENLLASIPIVNLQD